MKKKAVWDLMLVIFGFTPEGVRVCIYTGFFSHLYFRHTSKSLTVSIYPSLAGLRLPMINQLSVCTTPRVGVG